jgi:hypothetical protein
MSSKGIPWVLWHREIGGDKFHGEAMMRIVGPEGRTICFAVNICKDIAAVAEVVKRLAQVDPENGKRLASTEVQIYPSLEEQAQCARCGMECGGDA